MADEQRYIVRVVIIDTGGDDGGRLYAEEDYPKLLDVRSAPYRKVRDAVNMGKAFLDGFMIDSSEEPVLIGHVLEDGESIEEYIARVPLEKRVAIARTREVCQEQWVNGHLEPGEDNIAHDLEENEV